LTSETRIKEPEVQMDRGKEEEKDRKKKGKRGGRGGGIASVFWC
jgi:hypothetical protein